MSARVYRPWGLLNWLMDRGAGGQWAFIGCFGTERRSLATWEYLRASRRLRSVYFVRVDDPPSRYDDDINARLAERRARFEELGGDIRDVHIHGPVEALGVLLNNVRSFLDTAGSSVLIDITSMPKRAFFPIVKILRKDRRVANLLATYTVPASYPPVSIANDFREWQPLPLFSGDSSVSWRPDLMIVGIGFMPMRLQEELTPNRRQVPIKMIFPFPPGPPGFHRSWDMVRVLEEARERQGTEIKRVDAKDASDTFEHLLAMTNNGERSAIFAPFGPKPVSLAMCLFADQTNAPVYYTQPKAYHPDYSIGIAQVEGQPEIYGYYLRMAGQDFYKV